MQNNTQNDGKKKTLGISVPLLSLRKKNASLCGDFSDLVPLAKFCKKIDVNLIQILPVNDTGRDASPYGALSAFALHPIYLDVTLLPLSPALKKTYTALTKKYTSAKRIAFQEIFEAKLDIAEKFYAELQEPKKEKSADLAEIKKWQKTNTWVNAYAVFCVLKEKFALKSWRDWPKEFQNPTEKDITAWKKQYAPKVDFYIWLQYELFKQFQNVSLQMQELGVALKGDLPILMNEDSADVWLHRNLFSLHLHAGAPPDMFSHFGQNWGFPVYNWAEHKKEKYAWWRSRFKTAEQFYGYIRIDHVLGFFRIWTIPAYEKNGLSGYFSPFKLITQKDLNAFDFSQERINWLSKAHVEKNEILQIDPSFSQKWIHEFLSQIANEDLFLFRDDVNESVIETAIHEKKLQAKDEQAVLDLYHNKALLEVAKGKYFPQWYLHDSRAFHSLHDIEKEVFLGLVKDRYKESEEVWRKEGKQILAALKKDSSLFLCAEDLGAVPACVPQVMQELSIYGLRIERWSRHYENEQQNFYLPNEYKSETVFTVSVHDTSTLRDWWENEQQDSQKFYESLDFVKGAFPQQLDENLHYQVLRRAVTQVNSNIIIFQIQELIDLGHSLKSKNPQDDRINTPGTLSDLNWSYRLPASIEELQKETPWLATVKKLLAI